MLCRPWRAWDMQYVDGGGMFLLFQDGTGLWHSLRFFAVSLAPHIYHFNTAIRPDDCAWLPKEAVEVPPDDYRIRWYPDGNVSLVTLLLRSAPESGQ